MKRSYLFRIVIVMVVFMSGIYQVHATDVGGQILTDTTWTLAGSPYTITSDVQIASGVTLSIEPGVVVNRINNSEIGLYNGTFMAIGTVDSNITLNDLHIVNRKDGSSEIHIQYCRLYSTYLYLRWAESFSLLDSIVENKSGTQNAVEICPLNNDSYIERNVFIGNSLYNFIFLSDREVYNGNLYIRNNVFYNYRDMAISGNSDAIVKFNSFLNTDRTSVGLAFQSSDWDVSENYWNTTDTDIIESMIVDRNDNLSISGYIFYEPFLTAPHPDTTIFSDNQPPTAKSGQDQVVFDEVTLDGSGSLDPDGSIVSYEWVLQHKTDTSNNKTATGISPTVTGLAKGFYNMCLTVTDDGNASDSQCSLLAAAGSCFCTPNYIHVESIIPSTAAGNKGNKFGQVTVIVHDDCGNPASGVQVTGIFTGDYSETLTGTTASDGSVIITTTAETKKPSYEFCIDTLSHGTLKYISSDNVETCDGISR
jgi:hypothetical protein